MPLRSLPLLTAGPNHALPLRSSVESLTNPPDPLRLEALTSSTRAPYQTGLNQLLPDSVQFGSVFHREDLLVEPHRIDTRVEPELFDEMVATRQVRLHSRRALSRVDLEP